MMSTTETSFLNGKVRKHSLPVLESGGPNAPTLKRLMLAQGELAQVYDAEEPIRYLAVIELRPGCLRGNHYHKTKEEWVYVIQGEVLLRLQDASTRETASVSLQSGDLVNIQTGVVHSMETVKAGVAVEFAPVRHNPADTHRLG
jgi:quercetin dioxygenase-like cupin family protein